MTEHPRPWEPLLHSPDDRLDAEWDAVVAWAQRRFGQAPGIESMLFLVGLQARGEGMADRIPRELKQDVIMLGTQVVFEAVGLYRRLEDGVTWERTARLPVLTSDEQDKLLRAAIVRYFDAEGLAPQRP